MSGDEKGAIQLLHSLYAITQTRGQGKDHGAYCLKRAAGEACARPEYESCLANACPWLIFTKLGYMTLIKILKDYSIRAASGDHKAASVLKTVLLPRYQRIINSFMKEAKLDEEERHGMKLIMKGVLDDG